MGFMENLELDNLIDGLTNLSTSEESSKKNNLDKEIKDSESDLTQDSVKTYLSEIGKNTLLKSDEERNLAMDLEAADQLSSIGNLEELNAEKINLWLNESKKIYLESKNSLQILVDSSSFDINAYKLPFTELYENTELIELINSPFSEDFTNQIENKDRYLIDYANIKSGLIKYQNNFLDQSNLKLFLCGKKKSYFKEVKNYIYQNKVKDVNYLGQISQMRLINYYQNSFAVVMPSLYESSSLVLLEAICLKKIMIASNIGPNKELAKIFKIYLFNPHKKNDLSNKIKKVTKLKSTTKRKIVNNNYLKIRSYSWQNVAIKYNKLIKKYDKIW